jgi:hypothetical protein
MKAPRFRLRSLVVLIAFAALVLGIVVVSRENARLRAELKAAQQAQSRLGYITYGTLVYDDIDLGGMFLPQRALTTLDTNGANTIDWTNLPAQPLSTMPDGPDAFARTPADQ